MDPAIDLAPTPGLRLTVARVAAVMAAVFGGAILLLWASEAIGRIAPGELVWPVPPDVWGAVVFVTALIVMLGGVRMVTARAAASPFAPRRSGRGGGLDLLAAPVLLLIAVSAVARVVVQAAGFVGLHAVAVPVPFTVVGTTHDFSRGHDYYRLRLRYGDRGREFGDLVGQATYDAARNGDTVVLPVETGRFGLQRAMVATRLRPADLHHPG